MKLPVREPFRILAYGFGLEDNFGGPSVVHGLSAAVSRIYPESELVVYQPKAVDPVSVSDLAVPVKEFPYRKYPFKFYRDWLLLKLFGRRSNSKACAAFWDDFNAADAVAYIYPICFCSKIKTDVGVSSRRGALAALFKVFGIGLLARLSGKLSVKTTASFGPMENAGNAFLARLACRFAFTRVVARENECKREMMEVAHVTREIPVAPDLANCWHSESAVRSPDVLGVSVSYQSERQCARFSVDYVALMRGLIEHASSALGCRILILPNQFKKSGRDDAEVAREIMDALPPSVDVHCFDARHSSPSALHDAIAGCAVMVTCRYHSCVAAFASGVPQLVLGWHCKYLDLCEWYGVPGTVVSQDDFRLDRLCAKLDEIWKNRESLSETILAHRPKVESTVLSSVRYVFEDAAIRKAPCVSVIVPVYNVEKYLRRSLDSILGQTLENIEVVCVDDGSTDGSAAILDEYAVKDPRIRVIHQANNGAGAARNVGIGAAHGEYLFFFDPDDSCEKVMLEVMFRKARKTKADVVVAGRTVVDAETGAVIEELPLPRRMAWCMRQPFPPQKIADRIFTFAKSVPWDKMFRRDFVEEHALRFQCVPRSNDVYFVDMALALAKRIALVRKGYYRYSRRRGGSLTFGKDKWPLATFNAYSAVEESLKEHGLWNSFGMSLAKTFFSLVVDQLVFFRDKDAFDTMYYASRAKIIGFMKFAGLSSEMLNSPKKRERARLLLENESPEELWRSLPKNN
ncbi:MAG: glycosyltransferase [Lentisphaerae bacterium]|nr:glycosyltransferase [Lentisphaerota bacterium]